MEWYLWHQSRFVGFGNQAWWRWNITDINVAVTVMTVRKHEYDLNFTAELDLWSWAGQINVDKLKNRHNWMGLGVESLLKSDLS